MSEQEEPENTTYIATTAKGWAQGPNQRTAEIRALTNSYPEEGTEYKMHVYEVNASDWKVTGIGSVRSSYLEEVQAYKLDGHTASRITDLHNDALQLLGQGEPLQED